MNLTQAESEEIASSYGLGKISRIISLDGGLSNYNFEITTERGNFIIRFSSFNSDEQRRLRLLQQVCAIEFLRKKNFDYALPEPMMGDDGNYVHTLNGKDFWVYRKVEGAVKNNLKDVDMIQIATLVAKFHKAVEGMPIKHIPDDFQDYRRLKEDINTIRNRLKANHAKSKIDLFMGDYLTVLEQGLARIERIDFGPDRIFTHTDWFVGNLVYNGDNICGLIDFDCFEIGPRAKDVACTLQLYCLSEDNRWDEKAARLFLKTYESIYPLDKLDKYHLKDLIIREACFIAVFFYLRNKKADENKKLFMLKWSLESIKNLLDDIGKNNYL